MISELSYRAFAQPFVKSLLRSLPQSLVLLVLAGAAQGQTSPTQNPPAAPPPVKATAAISATPSPVDPSTAVITIKGLCPVGTPATPDCKTVITKADFDHLLEIAGPNMPPGMRRQLADNFSRSMVRSRAAEAMNLDQQSRFQEQMRLVRMQVLTSFLTRSLQEKAAEISDADLQAFYDANHPKFEQVTMQRVFIQKARLHGEGEKQKKMPTPTSKTPTKPAAKAAKPAAAPLSDDEEPTDATAKKQAAVDEAYMKTLAQDLQKRAVAGASFAELQKESSAKAGIPGAGPNVEMGKVSRGTLPSQHDFVFEMKPREVSKLIEDPNGFYIYKVVSKEIQPFDHVKAQIKAQMQTQRAQDALKKVDESATIEMNDAYFGPAGAIGQRPGPGLPPRPSPPVPQPKPKP